MYSTSQPTIPANGWLRYWVQLFNLKFSGRVAATVATATQCQSYDASFAIGQTDRYTIIKYSNGLDRMCVTRKTGTKRTSIPFTLDGNLHESCYFIPVSISIHFRATKHERALLGVSLKKQTNKFLMKKATNLKRKTEKRNVLPHILMFLFSLWTKEKWEKEKNAHYLI